MRPKAEGRPRTGEAALAMTEDDGVQVDSILIDQAKIGEPSRYQQLEFPVALGFQVADRTPRRSLPPGFTPPQGSGTNDGAAHEPNKMTVALRAARSPRSREAREVIRLG